MSSSALRKLAGLAGIAFFLIHAAALILADSYHHLLWSCHLGCLLVGIGLLIPNGWIYAVSSAWMVLGVPLWLLNVVSGAEVMPTSFFSHIGGLILALYGLRHLEIPRHLWLAATLALVCLALVTRWLTPPAENINLAFAVWSGWEAIFPSYFWYSLLLIVFAALTIFLFEKVVRIYQKNPR